MAHRRRFGLGCVLVVAVAVAGCDDPTDVQPRITGEVRLFDELGNVLPSADLVQVSALSVSSVRQYQTLTDAWGRFDLELPADETVPLMFTRDGFGDMFWYGLEDAAEPIQVDLFARSSAAVTGATAVAEPCGTVTCLRLALEVDDFFAAGTTRRLFRVYVSTDAGVVPYQYQVTGLLVVPNDQPGLVQTGSDATFELDGLGGLLDTFTTGTTVHLLIHGATENLTSSYTNPAYGIEVYTDLSEISARTSVVIP